MPAILMKMWNASDNEVYGWYVYGKNGKKRTRPSPVKRTRLDKIKERWGRLWQK